MLISELTVEVRDSSFERVGQILPKDLVGFKAVLRFNNVGTWEITLPAGHVAGEILRLPGSGIIVTGPNGVILSGPTISAVNSKTSDNPNGEWLISGVDDSIVLGERLAYPDPAVADVTAQNFTHDSRPGIASTAMYGYVEDNIGPSAPAARKIPNLTVATDTGIGSMVYPTARFDILGELLAGIASVDGIGFEIRQIDGLLEFRVFQPVDRSATIRMDVANNTLTKTEYAYGSHALSRAIVAGQGEGLNRQFIEVTSTESVAAETLWGRRIESFIDQRNTDDENELIQAGVEKLADGGATVTSVDVTPSSDITMAYGKDWNLGDIVTVVVAEQEVAATVTTVSMSIEEDGVRIGATVGEPTGVDYESVVAKKSTSQAQRVNALERKESPAIRWNDTDGTYEFVLKGENVTLQIGQEQVVYVKNNTGALLANGTVVYPTGSTGTNKLVAKAQANTEATSTMTFAVLTEDIPDGQHGFGVTFGLVRNINTSGLTEGQPVYLSPTVAGGLTSTKPSAPDHIVLVGFCIRSSATVGSIFVKIQNGFELDELHNVAISGLAAGELLVSTSGSAWANKTLSEAGITPAGIGAATSSHTHTLDNLSDVTITTPSSGQAVVYNGSGWVNGAATSQSDIPTGSIIPTALSTAPSGWLICDGSAVSRTTYANLFGVIGTTYGAGDGSTTFNLPDLRGRVVVGRDATQTEFDVLGEAGGAKTHTLTTAEMPSHQHSWSTDAQGGGLATGWAGVSSAVRVNTWNYTLNPSTGATGGGGAHNNLQPYRVLNYIIKFTSAFVSTDSELAARVGSLETADNTVNKAGLVSVVPTSVAAGSGSATVNAAGKVTFTGASSVSLNGVFTSAYTNYHLQWTATSTGASVYMHNRFRKAGVDNSAASYYSFGNSTNASGTQSGWSASAVGLGYITIMNGPQVGQADGTITMHRPQVNTFTSMLCHSYGRDGSSAQQQVATVTHYVNDSYDGITFFPQSGTMTGYLKVYGYRES